MQIYMNFNPLLYYLVKVLEVFTHILFLLLVCTYMHTRESDPNYFLKHYC